MLTDTQIAFNGAMALLMGLLVGIEREHAHKDLPWFAGIRTFPLITLSCISLPWWLTPAWPGS